MTRTELKHATQVELLNAMQVAFYRVSDNDAGEMNEADQGIFVAEMSKQMARVEMLFGYDPYSCGRA